jgi:hypothetical protein
MIPSPIHAGAAGKPVCTMGCTTHAHSPTSEVISRANLSEGWRLLRSRSGARNRLSGRLTVRPARLS